MKVWIAIALCLLIGLDAAIASYAYREAKEAAISESDVLREIHLRGVQQSLEELAADLYKQRERIEKLEARCK